MGGGGGDSRFIGWYKLYQGHHNGQGCMSMKGLRNCVGCPACNKEV